MASMLLSKPTRHRLQVRIGGVLYTSLLAEADSTRQVVRRKERVFTHHVHAAGRDVVHRLVEVVGSSSAQGVNLEFLHVDGLEAGSPYEPPAFLADVFDKEVVEQHDRDKYGLRALSEMPSLAARAASPSLAARAASPPLAARISSA